METDWGKLKVKLKSRGWDLNTSVPSDARFKNEIHSRILIAENDPNIFLSSFFRHLLNCSHIFLANPDWGMHRWLESIGLVKPHQWVGKIPNKVETEYQKNSESTVICHEQGPLIMLPTGGSTAGLRFAIHRWEHFEIAICGFQKHFNTAKINNCCILPLYHTGGLMQTLRSLLTDGTLVFPSWSQVREGHIPDFDPEDFFISLVPTQLRRLLKQPDAVEWLGQFRTVLLGGATADDPLLKDARSAGIRLAPSYGMTETAAMVASQVPEDFLQGKSGVGRPLSHAIIRVQDESGNSVRSGVPGRIIVKTETLSHGYYPATELPMSDGFITGDEGYYDRDGFLHIVGRLDRVINTGGEKVEPDEVETALFATGLVKDAWVLGRPDPEWGQRVTAVYVPINSEVTVVELKTRLHDKLTPSHMPKSWIPLDVIPRNAAGKIEHDHIDFG